MVAPSRPPELRRAPLLAAGACALALALLALAVERVQRLQTLDDRLRGHLAMSWTDSGRWLEDQASHLADPQRVALVAVAVLLAGLVLGERRRTLAAAVVIAGSVLTARALAGL